MGYINPLLKLPAGRRLLALPAEDRIRIAGVMRELRGQANEEAEKAWARRKGPMAAYWRAVATYARHLAHALERGALAKVDEEAAWQPGIECEHGYDACPICDASPKSNREKPRRTVDGIAKGCTCKHALGRRVIQPRDCPIHGTGSRKARQA